MVEFFEHKSYSLTEGTDEAIQKFIDQHPQDYDNKSHFVRCAIIKQFREERKKGKYITEGA